MPACRLAWRPLQADLSPTRAPVEPTGMTDRAWWILTAVGLGSLVGGIDGSVTNTVLPIIGADFHANVTTIEWVLMVYLLVMGSLMLTFGRLSDLLGHRRVYLAGFMLFVAASLGAGAAPNELVLIGFRALQGAGAALMASSGLALVTQAFGPRNRGKGIGMMISLTYFGLAIGPAVGGFLAAAFTWRAVFYVNAPLGLFGIVMGLRILPHDHGVRRQVHFDLLGAANVPGISLVTGYAH